MVHSKQTGFKAFQPRQVQSIH